MCGICADTKDPDGEAVRRMLPAMRHRGPDDEGCHVDAEASVAIGARRLSILDVEGGHQPIANEDGTVWAVLNGEIYNYPQLRRRLLDRGHRLATGCDTEVLAHLYEDFGEDLACALDGMYSFVIWDSRAQRLVAARDRFGEKPFFYTHEAGRLTIASELTALLEGLETSVDIDPAAVDAYFVFGYVPGPDSIDTRVRQLPPGHRMTWQRRDGSLDIRPYYSPPVFDAAQPDVFDTIAEVGELLQTSVASRMLADVPVGVFLSGGVDSSIVAALAARASGEPIRTFTIGYDVGDVSETPMAAQVASAIGSHHDELILEERDLLERTPELLRRVDQPLADQAFVALHALAEHARESITVALGGEGADEFFGGYPRYRWLARAERFEHIVPHGGATMLTAALDRIASDRVPRRLADVARPVPTLDRHLDWVTAGRRHVRRRVYGPALARRGFTETPASSLLANPQPAGVPVQAAFMNLDQRHWLVDDVLAKADRATMLASLEMRTPYLSREVASLAASVPLREHLRGKGKHVLRGLLGTLELPEERGRRKQAFRVPVADWLRGPLGPLLREQLATSAAYSEGWFDRRGVEGLIEEHRSGAADNNAILWPIVAFSCWLDSARERQA